VGLTAHGSNRCGIRAAMKLEICVPLYGLAVERSVNCHDVWITYSASLNGWS